MKTQSITQFLLFCVGISLGPAFASDSRPSRTLQGDSASRAVEVVISSGTTGIRAGLVIAYGHLLPKPYLLEVRNDIVYANGIQVEPSLAGSYQRMGAFIQKARKHYFENQGKVPSAQLHADVLTMIQANPLIKHAHWMNDSILVYTRKDSRYPDGEAISFIQGGRDSPKNPAPKQQSERKRQWLEGLKRDLEDGACLFWGTHTFWKGSPAQCHNIPELVNHILKASNTSSELKQNQLSQLFGGSTELPLDIMANYNSTEWQLLTFA